VIIIIIVTLGGVACSEECDTMTLLTNMERYFKEGKF
jgi:hypothetical protein